MRRIGQVRGSRSTGQLERLLVIGVGGLLALAVQTPLFAGLRPAPGTANGRSAAVATPVSTPLPTPAPVEAVATASPADEPTAEPARPPLANPPTYKVQAGGAGANMRGAPSTTAPVLEQVRDGRELTNLDEQRTADGVLWRRVADGPTDGWISAELLVPGS